MAADMVIKNGFLVMPGDGIVKASLAVNEGKVAGIFDHSFPLQAKEEIDATGLYAFPGVVQPHAHLGKGAEMEDFATEPSSAGVPSISAGLPDALFISLI